MRSKIVFIFGGKKRVTAVGVLGVAIMLATGMWATGAAHAMYRGSNSYNPCTTSFVICPDPLDSNLATPPGPLQTEYDTASLGATDTNPAVQTISNNKGDGANLGSTPTIVYPGDTISISMNYQINADYRNTCPGNGAFYMDPDDCANDTNSLGQSVTAGTGDARTIFAFIDVGDDTGFSNDLFGGFSGESGGPGAVQASNNPATTTTPSPPSDQYPNDVSYGGNYSKSSAAPDLPNNCPSYYYGPNSNYYNSNEPSTHPPAPAGGTYPTESVGGNPIPYTNDPGIHTCGTTGKSVVWTGAGGTSGNDYTYSVNLKIAPTATSFTKFCIRGAVSTSYIWREYTRTATYGCFQLQGTTVYGYVKSDPNAATGQGLNGVVVPVNGNCNLPTNGTTVTTANDASGNPGYYAFQAVEGAPVCIAPSGSISNPTEANGSSTNTIYNYPNTPSPPACDNGTSCGPYDITYQPIPIQMPPSKTASPASGTAVAPGSGMSFSLNASNPIDSNTATTYVADEIPLNIDPATVTSGTVTASVTNAGTGPPGWSVNATLTCTNGVAQNVAVLTPGSFTYGYNGSITADYVCNYSPPTSTTPGLVYVTFTNMPAYSQVTLGWSGTVVKAPQVGVYPTNAAYCNNGSVDYSSPSSIYGGPLSTSGCQDFKEGLQGVSNFGYSAINGQSAVFSSNDTYNPIPGAITSVGKTTTAQLSNPGAGYTSGSCGALQPNTSSDPTNHWVYSLDNADYENAQFTIDVCPDLTQGPVYYSLTDQDDGTHSSADMSALQSGSPLDPALQNVSNISSPGADTANVLHWNSIRSTDVPITGNPASPQSYNYDVKFSDEGNGHVATNSTKACWPDYWVAPSSPGVYPVSCTATASSIGVTQEAVTYPFVTTSNGDVHAGGGPSAAGAQNCTPPSGQLELGQNPGASGQYFVTASGNFDTALDTNKNQFFTSGAGAQSLNYGTVCRPDLVTSSENYITQNPSKHILWTGAIPANQQAAGWDGAVVEAFGNVTIPAGTVINARWTLLVHNGNVNIPGNITEQGAALNGQPEAQHSSFGVVVDNGNIEIDKGATTLDGFFYAAPLANTTTNGVINTCAGANGSPALETGYSVSDCSQPLTVDGLMMAYAFRLGRTTPPGAGASPTNPAEYVQFDDRLYTATPPGFSDLSQSYLPPIYEPSTNPRY